MQWEAEQREKSARVASAEKERHKRATQSFVDRPMTHFVRVADKPDSKLTRTSVAATGREEGAFHLEFHLSKLEQAPLAQFHRVERHCNDLSQE